jgi:hypothetical protein
VVKGMYNMVGAMGSIPTTTRKKETKKGRKGER